MGFRFRKSINLGGGVYGTFSAPGTGLSYRTKSVSGKQSRWLN